MKTSIFLLLTAVLLSSPVFSQEIAQPAADSVDVDNLLQAGLDELLTYLHLTKDDFVFRDDYLKKDPYRLGIVDSLMARPLNMVPFTDSCAGIIRQFEDHPDDVIDFLRKVRGTKAGISYVPPETSGIDPRALKRQGDISRYCQAITGFLATAQTDILNRMGGDWDSDVNRFIMSKYDDLILEDENFKQQTAEEMDSIQHLEEGYAREFAELAKDTPDIQYLHFETVYRYLDSCLHLVSANEKIRKQADKDKPIYETDTPYGRIVVGTFNDDTYRGDYFMIIDPGGDDSYYLTYDIENPHPTIIADFAGDDFYKAETDFTLASGALAYSLLVDYKGDDIYRGRNFSLGSGYFGQGILWDKKGNDSYFGDTFTQGAGTFGLGLLIDGGGNDIYTGNLHCQGFGYIRGIGGLADYDGNDTYTVQPKYPEVFHKGRHFQSLSQGFAIGYKPILSGGFGFICDYGGNDAYIADFFAQGSSYWWSLGMLYDRSGNDQYLTYQYAQGAGAHMTLGILLDGGGDDVYRSHGVAQGCGHDYSCGWLLDRGGEDVYSSEGLSQGAGQANGFGLFTDLTGNDGYYIFNKPNCQGYGNPRRDYGSIGLFLDMDGNDRYDGNGSNNRFWTIPSKWGGGLDRQMKTIDSTEATQ